MHTWALLAEMETRRPVSLPDPGRADEIALGSLSGYRSLAHGGQAPKAKSPELDLGAAALCFS